MADKPQSYANHVKFDPAFHFFLAPVGLILVIGSIVELVRDFGWTSGWHLLAVIWAFVAVAKTRLYAVGVQNRVIRDEERLRLEQKLPDSLRSRIPELTTSQLIGLRFASDGEVADLTEKTLAGNWDQKHIKQEVKHWRPDYQRV